MVLGGRRREAVLRHRKLRSLMPTPPPPRGPYSPSRLWRCEMRGRGLPIGFRRIS